MSSVVINGDTSGSVTLQAPAVAGSTLLTFPTTSGTLGLSGPSFSAYASATQTISLATDTKVAIDTEEFDTNNNFDTTTYRFTPTVAGYYQINGTARGQVASTFSTMSVKIYKNGSPFKSAQINGNLNAGTTNAPSISSIIYMNGSTDYLELYALMAGSGTATLNTSVVYSTSFFSGCFIRGA